jgi:hypothetical protein
MRFGVTLLAALVQEVGNLVLRKSPPEKEVVAPPPQMPALLGLSKGIQDGFACSSVLVPVLESLDVHARVYPCERPPDLEHRGEALLEQPNNPPRTQSTGVPS